MQLICESSEINIADKRHQHWICATIETFHVMLCKKCNKIVTHILTGITFMEFVEKVLVCYTIFHILTFLTAQHSILSCAE